MNYGFLSLLPPIVAVLLAIWSKNVILSLFCGGFVGALIFCGGNPFAAVHSMIGDYFFVQLTDSYNAGVLVLIVFIGGFIKLVEKSGGAQAFSKSVYHIVNTKLKAQLCAWLGGILIFFSDLGTPLLVGPVFRPLFDKLKISRQKLAWILDSTSSPVAILIPFIGWGVYIMGLIQAEFDNLGVADSDYTTFVQAIPFQLYAILAILMIPLVAFTHKDFSLMKKAEDQAAANDYSFEDSLSTADESTADAYSLQNAKPMMVILPIIVVFATLFITLAPQGCRIVRLGDSRERKKRPHLVKKLNHKSIKEGIQMKQNRIFDQNSSQKARSWHYNMDTNRAEAQFADGSAIAIDCLAIEDEYGNTPAQRAELDWLLYNKPLECVQLVLSGEIEHYLSLGCDHGKLKD